ncbi:hypothetical protein FA13DRAFT_1722799 [Coprinellus micaceus]|uniref:Uncharacterized protein n=1 Tax=Coprinellus micaceus TaxID=71717 RepID=A0A4Y7RJ23_COPMI|nr:hypothetical protein FA13DRAFT_1722799 [Coprinellus micaceus]
MHQCKERRRNGWDWPSFEFRGGVQLPKRHWGSESDGLLNLLIRGIDRLADDLWGNRELAIRHLLRSGIVEGRRNWGQTLVHVGAEAHDVERAIETTVPGDQELGVDSCNRAVVELGRVLGVLKLRLGMSGLGDVPVVDGEPELDATGLQLAIAQQGGTMTTERPACCWSPSGSVEALLMIRRFPVDPWAETINPSLTADGLRHEWRALVEGGWLMVSDGGCGEFLAAAQAVLSTQRRHSRGDPRALFAAVNLPRKKAGELGPCTIQIALVSSEFDARMSTARKARRRAEEGRNGQSMDPLSECQRLLFPRLLDVLGAGDEDTRGRLGLSVVALPDSFETGKFQGLWADALEVPEGGLDNTAGGSGAAENLVDEALNGDEVSKLGGSAPLDESRSEGVGIKAEAVNAAVEWDFGMARVEFDAGSSIWSSKTKIQTERRHKEAESCRAATELSCERPVEPSRGYDYWWPERNSELLDIGFKPDNNGRAEGRDRDRYIGEAGENGRDESDKGKANVAASAASPSASQGHFDSSIGVHSSSPIGHSISWTVTTTVQRVGMGTLLLPPRPARDRQVPGFLGGLKGAQLEELRAWESKAFRQWTLQLRRTLRWWDQVRTWDVLALRKDLDVGKLDLDLRDEDTAGWWQEEAKSAGLRGQGDALLSYGASWAKLRGVGDTRKNGRAEGGEDRSSFFPRGQRLVRGQWVLGLGKNQDSVGARRVWGRFGEALGDTKPEKARLSMHE